MAARVHLNCGCDRQLQCKHPTCPGAYAPVFLAGGMGNRGEDQHAYLFSLGNMLSGGGADAAQQSPLAWPVYQQCSKPPDPHVLVCLQ